jgi:hypothetical protein
MGGTAATTNCISAAPYASVTANDMAKSCLRMQVSSPTGAPSDMQTAAGWPGQGTLITGPIPGIITAESDVEFTFPRLVQVSGQGSGTTPLRFYRVTATTIGRVSTPDIGKQQLARGHIIVGPFQD